MTTEKKAKRARAQGKKTLAACLASASAALDASDPQGCEVALIDAWRLAPVDRIAELHVSLRARLPAPSPFAGKTVAAREEEWIEMATLGDAAFLPTLLALDWPVHPRPAKNRLALLKKFPPDLRIVRSLAELRKSGRYESNAGVTFWRAVFALLYKWRYPNVHAMFSDVREDTIEWYRFENLVAKPKIDPPTIDPESASLLDALEEQLGAKTKNATSRAEQRRALFDAVYETPHDDAPRLVLADFLMEEGDADLRGELIQIDIRLASEGKLPGKLAQRRVALVRAAGRKWLEGIDINLEEVELRRGFASRAVITQKIDPSTRAHRTLECLFFRADDDYACIDVPLSPNLFGVRELENVMPTLFESLVERGAGRTFDRITLADDEWNAWAPKTTTPFIKSDIFVRSLTIPSIGIAERLVDNGFIDSAHVEELTLVKSVGSLPKIAKTLFPKLPKRVLTINAGRLNAGWRVQLTRSEKPSAWHLKATWLENRMPPRDDLDAIVAQLPKGVIESVTAV